MTKIEQYIYDWIKKNLGLLCVIAVTAIRLWICFYLRRFESGDFHQDLQPWFEEIKANGGWQAMKQQVGNYNILYQMIIAGMTYLPFKALYLYKGLSIFFDFLLAGACGLLVCRLRDSEAQMLFAGVYAAVLLLPVTYLNSAAWAQCDSIYIAFVIMALCFLFEKKYVPSFLLLGVALAFKMQMIFILPFFLFYYFLEKKYSILNFILILAGWYGLSIPGILMRGNWLEPYQLYFQQTDTHRLMWLNFPSFWILVGDNYEMLKKPAILITVSVLGMALAYAMYKGKRLEQPLAFLQMAAWTAWTCILFLPAMHERYSYMVDILLILLIFVNSRYWIITAVEVISSLLRYQTYLFDGAEVSIIHAVIYLGAWLWFTWLVFFRTSSEAELQMQGN